MNINEAIEGRISTRAFLDKEISKETLNNLLKTSRWAPSGTNTQPWKVIVTTGDSKQKISDALLTAVKNKAEANPDYQYYPETWVEPFKSRRFQCGMDLYSALDIGRDDSKKRMEAGLNNFRFFGAPASLFFFIDKDMGKGSWVDMGMFIQTVMLAARELGLASCPQASVADFPDTIRAETGVSDQYHLICGLSLGYPDESKAVNQYRTKREDVDSFTTWLD